MEKELSCGHQTKNGIPILRSTRNKKKKQKKKAKSISNPRSKNRRLQRRRLLTKLIPYQACVRCGSHDNITVDHRIPLYLGGPDIPENWQWMCVKCNVDKDISIEDIDLWVEFEAKGLIIRRK